MKTKKIITISIIVLLFLMCCKKAKKTDFDNAEQSCLPGFIWINYAGITDKIKRFILIRTSENNSSYISYYNDEWRGLENDTTFFNIYCKSHIIDIKQFNNLKNYIITHNTYKGEELAYNDYNTAKIAVIDQCDSIEYVVNCEDKGYFSNIIDSVKISDESLIKYLEYYENIIRVDSIDIQRMRTWKPQYNSPCPISP
jgi:hypothetical protein